MVIDDVPTPISPMEAGIAGDEETARPGKSVKTAKLKAPEKKQAPKEHRETTLKPQITVHGAKPTKVFGKT